MKQWTAIVLFFLVIIGISCSFGGSRPGTGGTNSANQLPQTAHPETPDGVRCYVCHKEEIPTAEFHSDFSRECQECHGQTTWIAYKYPHERWTLGIHRQMQCARCHTEIESFDFSVWQCWNCHHDQAETTALHADLGFDDIDNCIMCHRGMPEVEDDEG